ncbi:hypothetical protein KQY27_04665 [Methanobrevibacter sp. TMH8]|uniref:hypothetical protein n=1 Tax=Methanobrevibacter sp. TMH8 TaxID=2848611 RepID=UPI001CC931F1|nr:hypothetical protein [Methanobrevibacter sp. TMH8]MBZ9570838.1 hypothetical protein [Methanobrevibacter sp. TMH8]
MSDVEINGNITPKRKIIMVLQWINRKTATNEGCEQFLIKKIVTGTNKYISTKNKFLKLSPEVLNDVLYNMESQNKVKFEIKFGREDIRLSIYKNTFSISTVNKELEIEIAEKLESEGKKMYPVICSKFPGRLGITNFP